MQRVPFQPHSEVMQSSDDPIAMHVSDAFLGHAAQVNSPVEMETLANEPSWCDPNPPLEISREAKADESDEFDPEPSISFPISPSSKAKYVPEEAIPHFFENEHVPENVPNLEHEEQTIERNEQTFHSEQDSSNLKLLLNNFIRSLNTNSVASDDTLLPTNIMPLLKNKRPHPRRSVRPVYSSPGARPAPTAADQTTQIRLPHSDEDTSSTQLIAQISSIPRRRCQSFSVNRTKSLCRTPAEQFRSMTQVFPLTQIPTPALDSASLCC